MADQTLTCTDCSKQFQFTESEQEFYQSKGFTTPGRCPDCRAARKAARQGGNSYGSASYGNSTYGSASYASASYGERQMYPAVCARCGKDTQVPFQPRGDKPVYCSDCYRTQQGGSSSYGNRSRSGGGSRY